MKINYVLASSSLVALNLQYANRRYFLLNEVGKMARTLNIKEIKKRIKRDKDTMKKLRPIIVENLNNLLQGDSVDGGKLRLHVSTFIRSGQAMKSDIVKLKITQGG